MGKNRIQSAGSALIMFRFANPQYLWLLLAVPALVALYWLS